MSSLLANKPDFTTEEDVRQFMEEVRSVPRLSAEEERELARRCAQGDEDAIRSMVNANLRLVVAVARRYYNGAVPLLDLVQEGAIGLLAAARKFDYTRDLRFSTYATKWIRQGVIRCAVDSSNPVRVPGYTADKMRKLTQAQAALRQELEREPTLEEIAKLSQIPADKAQQLLQLQPQLVSLDAPAGESDAIGDQVEDIRSPQPQEMLVRRELLQTMDRLLSMLTERQRQVLQLHFGMTDGVCHSLEQIGAMMGISKERARQIERQAMDRLKQLGADMGLEDFLE